MNYKMTDNGFNNAILDLLTFAKQEAFINSIVAKITKNGVDENSLVKKFDEDFLTAETRIKDLP